MMLCWILVTSAIKAMPAAPQESGFYFPRLNKAIGSFRATERKLTLNECKKVRQVPIMTSLDTGHWVSAAFSWAGLFVRSMHPLLM